MVRGNLRGNRIPSRSTSTKGLLRPGSALASALFEAQQVA